MIILREKLSKEKVEELLSIDVNDFGENLMIKLFATTSASKPLFNAHDTFFLPANTINNKKGMETTVGKYTINAFLLYRLFGQKVPYINEQFTTKVIGKMRQFVATMHMEDKISGKEHIQFYKGIKVYESTVEFIAPSANIDLMSPDPKLNKFIKDVTKKHKDGIEKGDITIMTKCDEEIVEKIEELYGDNEGFALYKTGGKPNVKDQMKQGIGNIGYVRIASKDYYISESFVGGVSVEGNIIEGVKAVDGVVDRNKSTAIGGYSYKLQIAGGQNIVIDKDPKSDCKVQKYMTVDINKKNYNNWLYCYIRKNKTSHDLVLLNTDNISDYYGEREMRVPLYCTNDLTCSRCASQRPHMMKMYNVGLLFGVQSGALLQKSLKSMHIASTQLFHIDLVELIADD